MSLPARRSNTSSILLPKADMSGALREAQGNKTRAAEILGIQRRLLYEKMREHGLDLSAKSESQSES